MEYADLANQKWYAAPVMWWVLAILMFVVGCGTDDPESYTYEITPKITANLCNIELPTINGHVLVNFKGEVLCVGGLDSLMQTPD